FRRTSKKTRALKATTIRMNPGIPRKPRRRSSLSSTGIATHGKGTQFARKVDHAVLYAMRLMRPCLIFAPFENPLPSVRAGWHLSEKTIHLCMQSVRRLLWRMSEAAPKRTPLYDEHVRLGARTVPFAGWLMPVQYTSIVEEHQAVRNNVGIFDISHMGQFIVEGAGGCHWLNSMLTNNVAKLDVGIGEYTFLLKDRGGIIDDLIIYRISEQKYLLVVNAARADEDFAWLQGHLREGISLTSRSAGFGAVAVQGPHTIALFHALFGKDIELPARNHIVDIPFNGTNVSVARTGYTGEDGIEVFFAAKDAVKFWSAVLEQGQPLG